MSPQAELIGPSATFAVELEDEVADVDIDPRRPIRDLIRHALVAHGLEPDARGCCLAGPDRLWYPDQRVADLRVGAMYQLRLPT